MMASTSEVVVVLPFVPVTATSCSAFAGCPKKFAAVTARAFRGSRTRIHATMDGIPDGGAASLPMAAAPRDTASRIKAFPSALAPCSAKNSAPGCTLRESQATWRISRSPAPAGTLASTPANKALSLLLRPAMRPSMEWPRSLFASFAVESLFFSSVCVNPILILMSGPPVRLGGLPRRRAELHGHLRSASHLGPSLRMLFHSKITSNQQRLEPEVQTHLRDLPHPPPRKVGHGDVAALVGGHGDFGSVRLRFGLCLVRRRGRRIGLPREIRWGKILQR